MVSISGLSKASVLAALYNASRPIGMGFMHYDPTPMTEADADAFITQHACGGGRRQLYFDYVQGRVMKTDLSSDTEFDPWGYDRDNGQGAAERVVTELRRTADVNTEAIRVHHEVGKSEAAEEARRGMKEETTVRTEGNIGVVELGLSDVADLLGPAINKATK